MLSEKQITAIYKTLSRELIIYLRRMTGNTDTAEDILHETFANLIQYSETREIDESSIRAFLYRAAHNNAVNLLKKNSRNVDLEVEKLSASAATDNRSRDSEEIEAEELNRRVYKYLDSIDPTDRSIFIMHKELGKTHVQIASDLNISERTVRRKMKAILSDIYDTLQKDGFI
ncbi:MAG TPA: sigma-70 family RNA polymerase sigma factor [Spirochaetota bacterium]|nr:sigma-70 family RNA polymerase sigma factor [Spirochaetota bacterium]